MGNTSQTTTKGKEMTNLIFTVYGEEFSHDEADGRFTHASVDKDGSLFVYKEMPTLNSRQAHEDQYQFSGINCKRIRGGVLLREGDWRDSVVQIEYTGTTYN